MKSYHLIISTPDGTVLDEQVRSILLRGSEGDLAVLAGHTPFVTSVQPCDCILETADGQEKTGHVEGGLLCVAKEQTTLLTGTFLWKSNG